MYETVEEVHEFLFPVRLTIIGVCDQQLDIEKYQLVLTDELAQRKVKYIGMSKCENSKSGLFPCLFVCFYF